MRDEEVGMPPGPTRRAVVGGGVAAAAALSLAACGIRLEDSAPRLPLIPTRSPIPGESFVVELRRHSLELASAATGLGGVRTGLASRLAGLHRTQAQVLRSELLALGVPEKVIDASATSGAPTTSTTPGSPGSTTAPTGPSTPQPARHTPLGLAADEAADLGTTAFAALADLTPSMIPLVGALLAQRAAAAALLGAPTAEPDRTWATHSSERSAQSLAASFLGSTRAAVYAFEVVAAQSVAGAQRTLALATLAVLQGRAQAQEALAGQAAAPAPLGYALPFPVTTPVDARRLAVQVLAELRAAVARDLETIGVDAGPLGSVVHWLGDTEALASRWGLPLAAFPGLR